MNVTLKCEMSGLCTEAVAMLDNKGFIYCATHGMERRRWGTPCRSLRPYEINRLRLAKTILHY